LLGLFALLSLTVFSKKTPSPIVAEQVKSAVLTRLKIPNINVDAKIEYVGLTEGGAMDVPKGPADVAWFALGTRPGDVGNAVIAGHRGWKQGKTAVFDDLDKLRKGDKVEVEDDTGKIISFIVTKTSTYDKDAIVPEVFTSDSGKRLNLISCVGDWDKVTQSSTKRLVVFTDIFE